MRVTLRQTLRAAFRRPAPPAPDAPLVGAPTAAEVALLERCELLTAALQQQHGTIEALREENARLHQVVADGLAATLHEHQKQAQVFGALVDELREMPYPIFAFRMPDDMTVH